MRVLATTSHVSVGTKSNPRKDVAHEVLKPCPSYSIAGNQGGISPCNNKLSSAEANAIKRREEMLDNPVCAVLRQCEHIAILKRILLGTQRRQDQGTVAVREV